MPKSKGYSVKSKELVVSMTAPSMVKISHASQGATKRDQLVLSTPALFWAVTWGLYGVQVGPERLEVVFSYIAVRVVVINHIRGRHVFGPFHLLILFLHH